MVYKYIKTFLFLFGLSFLPKEAMSLSRCSDLFLLKTESNDSVASRALKLLNKGEAEINVSFLFYGVGERVVNPKMSESMRAMASQLETANAGKEYVDLFFELSRVLSGELSISSYRRRGELPSYKKHKLFLESLRDKVAYEQWLGLEENSKYSVSGERYFFKRSGEYDTLLRKKERDREVVDYSFIRRVLFRNLIGETILKKIKSAQDVGREVTNFVFLSKAPNEVEVFKVEGYIVKLNKQSKKSRVVVTSVTRASMQAEVNHYRVLAEKAGIVDETIILQKPIRQRREVVIPGRIIYKLKNKHKIKVSELQEFFKNCCEPSRHEKLDYKGNHLSLDLKIGSSNLRVILSVDRESYNRLILKTAYEVFE